METTIYNQNDFDSLVERIQTASEALQQDARAVINRNVTCKILAIVSKKSDSV
jgi:hypothetical protein